MKVSFKGHHYQDDDKIGSITFTAFVKWGGDDMEEIDVIAVNEKHARDIVKGVLKLEYQTGGKIKEMIERMPGVMYF